jgi:acyl-CoA dehydrogenase
MKNIEAGSMQTLIADFAAKHVATRPDLQKSPDFPMDIWRQMGEAGLFKPGIAEIHGGAGGGYRDLLSAGEAFVKSGRNPGLAASWLYQQIIARAILATFGTPRQQSDYLRAAAAGRITLSFAVSEPGHGARAKMLTTSAIRRETGYELNGEKTYLTNGPIADIFIVIAVTDSAAAQKSFTAFIIPRETGGVTVGPPLTLNFLKPSLHGGIKLDHCLVDSDSVLGDIGSAWTDMVVRLGEIEDIVMTGPALGGMAAQLDMLTASLRNSAAASDRELYSEIGNLYSLLAALQVIACEAADRLDSGGPSPTPLGITFAQMAAWFQTVIARCISRSQAGVCEKYTLLQRDIESLSVLRKKVLQIRQEKIGAALLKNGAR